MTTTLRCGACESTDLRKLSLIYESGLTIVDAQSMGTGYTQTKGRYTTAAALRAAPPRQHTAKWATFGVVVCLIITIFSHLGGWLVAAGLCVIPVHQATHWNNAVWPRLYALWNAQFMCQRCGAITDLAPHGEPVPVGQTPLPEPHPEIIDTSTNRLML